MDLITGTVSSECTTANPYQFYIPDPTSTTETPKDDIPVNLVMPLGGIESGLYRSPKVGEKVLVATVDGANSSTTRYLMGYLPDNQTQTFSPIPKGSETEDASEVIDCKAEVFRYNKEGANTSSRPYSELGFYQKDTLWKETDDKDAKPPKVDRINIQSTGDIYTDADNHHRLTARRLEMLTTALQTGFNGEDVNDASKSMNSGDIRILAEGDITIEAGNSITLRVGRTSVKISDKGFSVVSQLLESAAPNPFDSTLDVNNKDGVSMFGKTVGINSGYKWSISNGFNTNISGTVGNIALGGRQIEMSTQGMPEQVINDVLYGCDMAASITMAGLALDAARHPSHSESAQKAQFWTLLWDNILKGLANLGLAIKTKTYESWQKKFSGTVGTDPDKKKPIDAGNPRDPKSSSYAQATENKGTFDADQESADAAEALLKMGNEFRPYTLLCTLFDFLMETIKTARTTIEDRLGIESTEHRLWTTVTHLATADFINAETSERDTLNLAFLVVESTVVELFASLGTVMANASAGADKLATASVSLLQNGGIEMKGDYLVNKYADSKKAAASTLTLVPRWVAIGGFWATIGTKLAKLTKNVTGAVDAGNSIKVKDPGNPPIIPKGSK
ncbi:MAG: hypothetical protein LBK66_04560 [Spirochaetaceae bacterium]|jgi:hypothetical protein|nr:hypothetical protein [Spirochaetaceae bacterium]